jgi:pimeloyl-ACP methyl ester carboxylesterase
MSITTIEGKPVHYEVTGHGDPILFLHGWIGSWRIWWPTMKATSDSGRSFAMDFWGYGDSSKLPDGYLFGAYVEQVGHFIEHLGIAEPVTLVGHSLGAAVALRFANLHPARVRRLVLVSPPLNGGGINEKLAQMRPEEFATRYLYTFMNEPDISEGLKKSDPQAITSVAGQLLAYEFGTDIERIDSSVLVIVGDRDQVVSQPVGGILSNLRKGKRHHRVVLKTCDHFPMIEQPSRFYRLLTDFNRLDVIRDTAPLSP